MAEPPLPVAVTKPTPITFDLGYLLASDTNPLALDPALDKEDALKATARDGAQAIINQLLTTCPISSTPEGVLLTLPPRGAGLLPREKPLPQPKPPTKWEAFAARRGIRPKTREQRRNLQYNEASGEWERRWGYKGANKAAETDWLVEVDPKKEAAAAEKGSTVRGAARTERKERVKRNERRMRKNERTAQGRK